MSMNYIKLASRMNHKNRMFDLLLFMKETLFCTTGQWLAVQYNLPSPSCAQYQLPSHTMRAIEILHILVYNNIYMSK